MNYCWREKDCKAREARKTRADKMSDNINPKHYKEHPSGVECIEITEHMNFCLGNAVKYLFRAGRKGDAIEDLKKARWYISREIARRTITVRLWRLVQRRLRGAGRLGKRIEKFETYLRHEPEGNVRQTLERIREASVATWATECLKAAQQYIDREIARIEG